ncbi:trypco2 family protein [Actinokineospora sp. NPDC004072]
MEEDNGLVLMDEDGISLSTAVELLRAELAEALAAGEGERVRFVPERVEVELEITAKVSKKGNGSVSLWKVATIGGSRQNDQTATHRLRLTLRPRDMTLSTEDDMLIGDLA